MSATERASVNHQWRYVMRRTILILTVAVALLAPAVAEARPDGVCVCRAWAQQFMAHPSAQREFDRDTMFNMTQAQSRKVKQTVYDYAKTGDFKDKFCKKNRKVCKAALACVIAGGGAYSSARAAGSSRASSARAGAWACAGAAGAVMIAP